MTRRELFKSSLFLPLFSACAAYLLSACGRASTATSPAAVGGDCKANGTTATFATNHGHGAPTITGADVTAGTQQTFAVTAGTAAHTHALTVTAANFATLQGNMTVANLVTDADGTGHTHTITLSCV